MLVRPNSSKLDFNQDATMASKRAGNVSKYTVCKLWAKAAGRCEYDGCNKRLYKDDLTNEEINSAYIAHIIAASPDGPRGSESDSARLVDDLDNVMLLCNDHHRLIDHEGLAEHPVSRLREMKRKHEERIRMLTEIKDSKVSLPVIYAANIGDKTHSISKSEFSNAMVPENYPSEKVVDISYRNSSTYDNEGLFWQMENKQISDKVSKDVLPVFTEGNYDSISLFALGPQPLLVSLGTKLNDLYKVKVFQKHREPDTWAWQVEGKSEIFRVESPEDKSKAPVLIFAISAGAIVPRVKRKYEDKNSIWVITVDEPNNDVLKSAGQLSEFRNITRKVLDEINKSSATPDLKVFMAMPAACAVEFGRVWMPKADKTLVLFDKNNALGADDIEAITIRKD